MTTYLIKREISITRQEGDTADVVVVVPEILDMNSYSAQFQVRDTNRRTLFNKSSEDGTIQISGQTITIPLLPEDTKNRPGKHRWELQIASQTQLITIGRGNFSIIHEIIR